MSIGTPDTTDGIDSVPVAEVSEFDDTDDDDGRRPTGGVSGALRPAQRFREAMHTTDE